ncbi:MAG: MFS transporter, partial [Candidatus Hadarchaeales archaeon]
MQSRVLTAMISFSYMRGLMLCTFVLSLAMGMVNLAVPLYASELGASYTEIGMLGVTYILLYVVLCVPVGRWSDRFGRRIFVLLGFAGTAAVFSGYYFAFSFPVLLVARLFQGGMEAFIWTSLQGIVADTSSPSKRGLAMGKYGSSWALGFGMGPLVAGSLYASLGARTIFAIGAIVAAVSTSMMPELPRPTGSGGRGVSIEKIAYPALIGLLYTGMISVMLIMLPPYVRTALGMSEAEAGILITVFTLTRALLFIPFGTLSDRAGARRIMKWAL